MVVDVSSLSPLSTEPLRPWRLQCSRPILGASDRRPGVGIFDAIWTTPRGAACQPPCSRAHLDEFTPSEQDRTITYAATLAPKGMSDERREATSPRSSSSSSYSPSPWSPPPPPSPSTSPSLSTNPPLDGTLLEPQCFTFAALPESSEKEPLAFGIDDSSQAGPSLKRARPATDVDGPNTASLSCKKRRLRLELITSRLSQPFSLPATHILNREGLACGDKRFLKMAAHADLVRRGLAAHSPTSAFRRMAVMNRTRLWVKDNHLNDLGALLSRTMITRSAAAAAAAAAQYHSVHPSGNRMPAGREPILAQQIQNVPVPRIVSKSRSPRPSPPASPVLRPVDLLEHPVFEDEDEGEAFPTMEHGGVYDFSDDSEDVYSDFAAIFGSGPNTTEAEDHSYEEYLDELDGISWAR